jgi:glycosyltransferase involved in cell wall biosynthesis
MPKGYKVIAIMPAYNAAKTLRRTLADIPAGSVDEIILTDDCSSDETVALAQALGLRVLRHDANRGYGGNQKTCYDAALASGADVIVMVHPDYQYDPRVIPFAVGFIRANICDVIVASRIRTRRETLDGGMPLYKYIANRILTAVENVVFGQNLGDFHSGFRVYSRAVLERIAYQTNSDDFVFDTEFLAQAVYHGFKLGDVPIPARYFQDASSISLRRSIRYGLGTVAVMLQFMLQSCGVARFTLFAEAAQVAPPEPAAPAHVSDGAKGSR